MLYDGLFGHAIGWLIPGTFLDRASLKGLRHQTSYLFSAQGNKRSIFVLVELGTKIQRVYSRIESIDDEEIFRFAKQPALFYELSFLCNQRHSQLAALITHDGGRFQQDQPIACLCIVGVDRNMLP